MASVTQLKCKCIGDAIFVGPVHRTTRAHIWGRKKKYRDLFVLLKEIYCYHNIVLKTLSEYLQLKALSSNTLEDKALSTLISQRSSWASNISWKGLSVLYD